MKIEVNIKKLNEEKEKSEGKPDEIQITENEAEHLIKYSAGVDEILCVLAEEASELAQAALKLRRVDNPSNPTVKNSHQCKENIVEEVADIYTCLKLLGFFDTHYKNDMIEISKEKLFRWANRIKEARKNC